MNFSNKQFLVLTSAALPILDQLPSAITFSEQTYCVYKDTTELFVHLDDFFALVAAEAPHASRYIIFTNFSAHLLNNKKLSEKTKCHFSHINLISAPLPFLVWCSENNIDYLDKYDSLIKDLYPKAHFNEYSAESVYQTISASSKNITLGSEEFSKNFLNNLRFYITYERINRFVATTQITTQEFFKSLNKYLPSMLCYDHQLIQKIQDDYFNPEKVQQVTDAWSASTKQYFNQMIKRSYVSCYPPYTTTLPLEYLIKEEPSTHSSNNILISLQLNTNRPAQLRTLFDNIEATASSPELCEFVLNIDEGDTITEAVILEEQARRKFKIKYTCSRRPRTVCDLWQPLNKLYEMTDPSAYFLINISDEMLFITRGWDDILKKYVGYFEDDLFRLRCSRNKYRNYFDRWQCSFAQDSIAITTKKWLDIGGDWNPCFGPDGFQQLISFYLTQANQFSTSNYCRDIPFDEIKFSGDAPALGITDDDTIKHILAHIDALFIAQSHYYQTEAYRRAMTIQAKIDAHRQNVTNFSLIDKNHKISLVNNETNVVLGHYPYKLSRLKIYLTNTYRKFYFPYYFGEGLKKKNIFKGFLFFVIVILFRGYNQRLKAGLKTRLGTIISTLIKSILHPRKAVVKLKNILGSKFLQLINREKRIRKLNLALANAEKNLKIENEEKLKIQTLLKKIIQERLRATSTVEKV